MKKSKRYRASVEKVDAKKKVTIVEAAKLVKECASAKFDESIVLSVKLNLDPKKAEQNIRSTVILPHGTGKTKKVAVMAKSEKAQEAKEAGADVIGAEDLSAEIQKGIINFDVLIATPDMMKEMGKLGKILGPRGLMPNPKSGTVTFDLKKAVNEVKSGRIEFRVDPYGILHTVVGKASFDAKSLFENVKIILDAVIRVKPVTVKGTYIQSITLSSTMGPGVKIDPNNMYAE
ncbi:MAG: 50S ribosomal protein L1 [Elusimicrobiota bacterium]